jgi:hypothetical protein
MTEPSVLFVCHVPKVGFRWLETHPIPPTAQNRDWFLTVGREPAVRGGGGQTYNPLEEHTGLFRVFADTEPSRDDIKAFAERFGSLGGDTRTWVALYDEPRNGGYAGAWSEAYTAWCGEIVDMHRSVDLWEAARRGETEELGRKICWTDDHSRVDFNTHPGLMPSERMQLGQASFSSPIAERGDGILERFVPGDLVQPALFYVQRLVNQHLRTRVSPRLLWDEHETRLRLHLVPEGLVGALWLQFASAIENDREFRRCAECNIWFELAPGTARSDKLYCSNACRTKAYRRRRADALRLNAEGHPIEQIAEQIHADVESVHSWIQRQQTPGDSGFDEET